MPDTPRLSFVPLIGIAAFASALSVAIAPVQSRASDAECPSDANVVLDGWVNFAESPAKVCVTSPQVEGNNKEVKYVIGDDKEDYMQGNLEDLWFLNNSVWKGSNTTSDSRLL